jgi:photosystem II stability/assembly factor-like uncharacterized protein
MWRPLAIAIVLVSTGAGATPPAWRWEHPVLYGGPLHEIHGPGPSVLAVGPRGALFLSRDGARSWRAIAGGTAEDLHGIAGGDPLWIVVGGGGTVLRSRDGAMFERRPTGLRDALVAVALAGQLVLAVSEHGAVLRSQNGADTFQVLPGVREPATSIAIDPSGVLVGTLGGLWRSTDRGATFSRITDEPIQMIRVAPDGTVYALGGGHVTFPTHDPISLYRSLDGATWRRRAVRDVGSHPRGWWPVRRPTLSARGPWTGDEAAGGPSPRARLAGAAR